MFFIGIFGVEEKANEIGFQNNKVCFNCQSLTIFNFIKTYSYFHVFFIPVFKWNVKYYIKSNCCNATYMLAENIGKSIESGENVTITENDIIETMVSKDKYCSNCNISLPRNYDFCPKCGSKLS